MRRIEQACIALGAVLVVAGLVGIALVFWPATATIVGAGLVVAGVDRKGGG